MRNFAKFKVDSKLRSGEGGEIALVLKGGEKRGCTKARVVSLPTAIIL